MSALCSPLFLLFITCSLYFLNPFLSHHFPSVSLLHHKPSNFLQAESKLQVCEASLEFECLVCLPVCVFDVIT